MYNNHVKLELAVAQLAIVDGTWQDAPDNIAIFDEAALFGEGLSRGNLYVVTEVAGEIEGRDSLARELIETVRREYAASRGRGSIAHALADAVRAANEFFYSTNVNLLPEQRRIAGITAAVLRDNELFSAQAGPGLACLMRGNELRRYPDTSPWFMADDAAVADWLASRDFQTPGAVPIGIRRNYTPDLFHAWLKPGDIIVLSTRYLVHLLSNEELADTLAHRHPDQIISGLADLAGASDLSVIVLGASGDDVAPEPTAEPGITPTYTPPQPTEEEYLDFPWMSSARPSVAESPKPMTLPGVSEPTPLPAEPTLEIEFVPDEPSEEDLARQREAEDLAQQKRMQEELERKRALEELAQKREQEELEHKRIQEEQARARRAKIQSGVFRAGAGVAGGLAQALGRINGAAIGNAADRLIDGVIRGIARATVFMIRAVVPGEPEQATEREASPARSTAWQLASLVLPILLIAAGVWTWVSYRTDQQRIQTQALNQLITDSTTTLERAKQLAPSEKNTARDMAQNALNLAQQARAKSPNDTRASKAFYDAQDYLDGLNGILTLFIQPSFITFKDPQANPSRIVTHYPDVFVLDRGTQSIYRYTISDPGTVVTATASIILKTGDKPTDRVVGPLMDMLWLDAGRLLVLDRNGVFWKYDPSRSAWEYKTISDSGAWARVNLVTSYAGNLYLIDAPNKQILKYVPVGDWWTSPVTFFNPGVNPDLSTVVDLAIDGDVWMLKGTGTILKCSVARCADQPIAEIDTPITKTVSLYTSQTLAGLYIADSGGQRIVQMDKATGRFARQFKPRGQDRDAFTALKAFAVDDKRFYFVNGNQAYFANIPQQ